MKAEVLSFSLCLQFPFDLKRKRTLALRSLYQTGHQRKSCTDCAFDRQATRIPIQSEKGHNKELGILKRAVVPMRRRAVSIALRRHAE